MLNLVSPIIPLPPNIVEQLQKIDDFYICTTFNEDLIGPRVAKIGARIYYRFMKYIYLPQLPEKLNPEQVIKVCNLRHNYMRELVDHKLNDNIVNTMVENTLSSSTNISSQPKVLDFGCGSGSSSLSLLECIPNAEIVGIDISEKAVLHSLKQGLTALETFPSRPLPFKSATFDLIFAVFVMHFNIDIPTLVELRRVLRSSGGHFVFNFRERDKDEIPEQPSMRNVDVVIRQLEEAGFCSIKVLSHIEGISPNHKIISCSPLPLLETASHGKSNRA